MIRLRGNRSGSNTISFVHSNNGNSVSLNIQEANNNILTNPFLSNTRQLVNRNRPLQQLTGNHNRQYIDPFEYNNSGPLSLLNPRSNTNVTNNSLSNNLEDLMSRVVEEVSNGVVDDLFQIHQEEEEEEYHTPASPRAIEQLKPKEFSDNEAEECQKCTICLDSITSDQETLQMPCNHYFHKGCLEKWLSTDNTCPICRQVLEYRETDDVQGEQKSDQIRISFKISDTGEEYDKSFSTEQAIGSVLEEIQADLQQKNTNINVTDCELCIKNKEDGSNICNCTRLQPESENS
jgi:hypothetical protein